MFVIHLLAVTSCFKFFIKKKWALYCVPVYISYMGVLSNFVAGIGREVVKQQECSSALGEYNWMVLVGHTPEYPPSLVPGVCTYFRYS